MDREHKILQEVEAFLVDRQSRRLADSSLIYYADELERMTNFLHEQGVSTMERVDADLIRKFAIELGKTRSAGGVRTTFRAVKVFLRWWEREVEPEDWRNPLNKVQLPRASTPPLEGVPIDDVLAMVATCEDDFHGRRDEAMLLFLVDSGVRKSEFADLMLSDVDLSSGAVMVRHGKGDKSRVTYVGTRTRKALIRYLRLRGSGDGPLWVTEEGAGLRPAGIRSMIKRRADKIGIDEPGMHDFRRTFALERLRNGCNVYALMHMMGHTSLTVLRRYVRMVESDVRNAHETSSPVDNS